MGLFGNKDGKTGKDTNGPKEPSTPEQKSNEVGKSQLTSSQSLQFKNVFEEIAAPFSGVYDSFKQQTNQLLDSPQLQEARRWRQEFADGFCHPLADIYRSVPQNVTKFKYSAFGAYSFRERLFGLQGLTLLIAIYTFGKSKGQIGAVNRLLFATRNATAGYLLGGLLVAPEIYNPLIKGDL